MVMERFFVEQEKDGRYCVAAVDKHRIFLAENPGTLATVFECSITNPTREDDAQIFYAMAPSIGADNFFIDMKERYRSHRLNSWSIGIKNENTPNLFMAVNPLNHQDRMKIYSVKQSITPKETVVSNSDSLFSLTAFSGALTWKTGILQRCIDCLVMPEYRGKPEVYSIIDQEYRRLMRFKLETETDGFFDVENGIWASFIKRIVNVLGLKNSHDTTVFKTIPQDISSYLNFFAKVAPAIVSLTSVKDDLSRLLTMWSGASIVECEDGFQLKVDPDVLQGLSYMQPLLPIPKNLVILDTPM